MGMWLNESVFCVLLEVADRDMVGAGPFIFREFCRQARDKGAWWINTMDDSGLPRSGSRQTLVSSCAIVAQLHCDGASTMTASSCRVLTPFVSLVARLDRRTTIVAFVIGVVMLRSIEVRMVEATGENLTLASAEIADKLDRLLF